MIVNPHRHHILTVKLVHADEIKNSLQFKKEIKNYQRYAKTEYILAHC